MSFNVNLGGKHVELKHNDIYDEYFKLLNSYEIMNNNVVLKWFRYKNNLNPEVIYQSHAYGITCNNSGENTMIFKKKILLLSLIYAYPHLSVWVGRLNTEYNIIIHIKQVQQGLLMHNFCLKITARLQFHHKLSRGLMSMIQNVVFCILKIIHY